MRVVLHAGLHKSGTTAVQAAWLRAYTEDSVAWYPAVAGGSPGHHRLMWPLLDAYLQGTAPDLVGPAVTKAGQGHALGRVMEQAHARGVEALVLSAEDLDRAEGADSKRIREAFDDADVTTLLTVTKPMHRWASGWQELVKHGLAQYPSDAVRHVVKFANLQPHRLRELVGLLPGRTVVRLVESPEPDLPAELADLVDLPSGAPCLRGVQIHNRAIGTDIELLRRINDADLAVGTIRGGGLKLIERLRGQGFEYREPPGLALRYEAPATLSDAAAAEADFLSTSSDITLHDPHGLLHGWTDPTPPDWYRTISTREAAVSLPPRGDLEEQLWRTRQERAALQGKVAELKRRIHAGVDAT